MTKDSFQIRFFDDYLRGVIIAFCETPKERLCDMDNWNQWCLAWMKSYCPVIKCQSMPKYCSQSMSIFNTINACPASSKISRGMSLWLRYITKSFCRVIISHYITILPSSTRFYAINLKIITVKNTKNRSFWSENPRRLLFFTFLMSGA